jgi:histidinol-phosphatase (PHP family)
VYDYHVHSVYSDGSRFEPMVAAAAEAGVTAVGFADHCNLSVDARRQRERARYHRNFDLTYERRREALAAVRAETDLTVFDAVEVDYEPAAEEDIAAFLQEAGFDYSLGSVHYVGDRDVFGYDSFAAESEQERRRFVDDYYDTVVSLIDSELFDIAAHVDIVESHPDLSGLTTCAHAERVADAFQRSRTVPELNAGRFEDEEKPAAFHPEGRVFEMLLDRGVEFTLGTDAHSPDDFAERVPALRDRAQRYGIDPVCPL